MDYPQAQAQAQAAQAQQPDFKHIPEVERRCNVLKRLKGVVLVAQSRGAFLLEESAALYNSIKRTDEYISLHNMKKTDSRR